MAKACNRCGNAPCPAITEAPDLAIEIAEALKICTLTRIADTLEKLFQLRFCEACAKAAANAETGVDAALVAAIRKVFGDDFDVETGRRKGRGPHA